MLTIRLSRTGRRNKPMYRLVISEKSKTPKARALEYLGSYNPHTKELQAKGDRIKYWLSQGSGMSDTVNNLLISKQIINGKKRAVTKCIKKVVVSEEKNKESNSSSKVADDKANITKTEEPKVKENGSKKEDTTEEGKKVENDDEKITEIKKDDNSKVE